MYNNLKIKFASAFIALLLFSGMAFAQANYKVTGKIMIGGETRWDYLSIDKTHNHLFASNNNKVQIIDLKTEKVIGEIANQTGVHGVEFVPALNKGYISNRDGQITVFDLKTFKVLKSIKIEEKNPDAIMYDSYSKRIYTMNHTGKSVTAIDPVKDVPVATVSIDGTAEAAASDNHGRIFVNLEDKSEVCVIDTKTMKVIANWDIKPCEAPTGMAIDLKTKRLFTVGENRMAVLDYNTGKVIATLPIGGGCDGCAFDPAAKLIFSSNGEGTMSVIKEESADNFKPAATIETVKGARTITLDPVTHKVYSLAAFETGKTNSDGKPERIFGVLIVSPVK